MYPFHSIIPAAWCATVKQWLSPVSTPPATTPPAVPLGRPNLSQLAHLDPSQLPPFVQECPVAMKYLRLLGDLDWEHFPERPTHRAWPGPHPHPRAPFVAAFLVKIQENKTSMADLRTYLAEHPALVWLLGFRLVPATTGPWGFDVQASLPDRRQFSRILRQLPNDCLQFLLTSTVHLLQAELPADLALGDAISLDTKLILAWVKQNNPKTYVPDRFDKSVQPAGDPDCKLGCKERHNRAPEPPPTPTTDPLPATGQDVGEFYWGYASGVVATKNPWGEFVLAESTQPFNCSDVSYFFPLLAQVEDRLGRRPRFGSLDSAYDAHYVYEYFHTAGGFAAVPLAERGGYPPRRFDEEGLPLCAAGLPMPVRYTFWCKTSLFPHQQARHACPLLFPAPTGQPCPVHDPHFAKEGCVTTLATSIGARLRAQLDRDSTEFKRVYNQRSAVERVNSLAVEMGIERPKLRNQCSIANQNTLIYVLLNLRALQRVRERKAAPPSTA
jgi:hypothetical protein